MRLRVFRVLKVRRRRFAVISVFAAIALGGCAPGYIKGTVSDSGTGAPLSGICVSASAPGGSAAATTSNGAYTLSHELKVAVTVRVQFSGCGQNYLTQYSNPVTVGPGQTRAGVNAAMVVGGKIRGTVTDSTTHTAVAGICAQAYDGNGNVAGSAHTDASGAYTINALPTGSYRIGFSPGCGASNYLTQYYSDKGTLASADSVAVTQGRTKKGIDAAMVEGAQISGTVTDSKTQAAISGGICVQAYDGSGSVVGSAQTDPSSGTYTINALPTGSYRVGFSDCNNLGYVAQYYNDKGTLASADSVAVTQGSMKSGIDAAMVPEGQISGTVTDGATHAALSGICVQVYDANGNSVASMQTDSGGAYTSSHLPSGSYRVGFTDCNGLGYVAQYYNHEKSLTSADPVTVSDGTMTNGIDAAMVAEGQISGTVTDSATHAALSGICVQVYDASGNSVASMQTDSGGAYTSPHLPSGSYRVGFTDCNGLGYVAQYYHDRASLTKADQVTVTDGTTTKIDAAMVAEGQISGTVTDGATHAALSGICVQVYDGSGGAVAQTTQTNSSGVYTAAHLAPGSYRVGFIDCNGLGYVAQYYHDKPSPAKADPVVVTDGGTTSGIDAAMAVVPKVFAGYADTSRTGLSRPSPWQGSSNVVFEGCNYSIPSRCPSGFHRYDSGALRLDNSTAQAMTVTNATVTIGSCTFKPWPGLGVTVPAGKSLILAQTGGDPPCGGAGNYNFNTSDTNTSSTKCTENDGKVPVFHVTVDGHALTYLDTGQILNTGGKDPGAPGCGSHDETHAWTPIEAAARLRASAAADFWRDPLEANPQPDSTGFGRWEFDQTNAGYTNPSGYSPLGSFTATAFDIPGIEQWAGSYQSPPNNDLPAIGVNATGSSQHYEGISWPNAAMRMHPASGDGAVLAWRARAQVSVHVTGEVRKIQTACGPGFAWRLERPDGSALAAGTVAGTDYVAHQFTAQARLSPSQAVYLVIYAPINNACDSTMVQLNVAVG